MGYQAHYVVDGGRARITLTVLVTPAEARENQPALDLLWRVRFRWKLRPRQAAGDAKHATIENITAIERERIHIAVPLAMVGQRAGRFGEQDFVFDASADVYRCPGTSGSTSSRSVTRPIVGSIKRQRPPAPPASSAPSAQPPGGDDGSAAASTPPRSIGCVVTTRASPMRRPCASGRSGWSRLFAEAKEWHGLRRFRLRGLEKVNGEALLIAAGQNLKRLLSWRGWGRRPFPSGAAGIGFPALPSPLTVAP